MNCYKEIQLMLDYFNQSYFSPSNEQESSSSSSNNKFDQSNHLKRNNEKILEIVSMSLQTADKLLHIAVYEWLLSHNLLAELLNISEPSLGEFLTHSLNRNQENLYLADILWKYHEQNGQHAAATEILDNLASMPSNTISLPQRIEYLARAVMCMRSDSVGYSAQNGLFYKNLEDKVCALICY